jgi:hypothetical protein
MTPSRTLATLRSPASAGLPKLPSGAFRVATASATMESNA